MPNLSQQDWKEQLSITPDAVILDVRSEEELETGYIPNAINIDIRMGAGFLEELESLDKTKTYFVYCRSGARSAQACQLMQQVGFSSTYNLVGGILEWKGELTE